MEFRIYKIIKQPKNVIMKIEYINETYDTNGNGFYLSLSPLTYRVSIRENSDVITIKREYFKYGYHDHESLDAVCVMKGDNDINMVSIFTRDFDEQHLKDIEKLIIAVYQKETKKIVSKIEKKIKNKIDQSKLKIQNYTKIHNFIKNYERREKLKKINLNE